MGPFRGNMIKQDSFSFPYDTCPPLIFLINDTAIISSSYARPSQGLLQKPHSTSPLPSSMSNRWSNPVRSPLDSEVLLSSPHCSTWGQVLTSLSLPRSLLSPPLGGRRSAGAVPAEWPSVKLEPESPSSYSGVPHDLGKLFNLLCLSFLFWETGIIISPAASGYYCEE